jgi:hypothetical protein
VARIGRRSRNFTMRCRVGAESGPRKELCQATPGSPREERLRESFRRGSRALQIVLHEGVSEFKPVVRRRARYAGLLGQRGAKDYHSLTSVLKSCARTGELKRNDDDMAV